MKKKAKKSMSYLDAFVDNLFWFVNLWRVFLLFNVLFIIFYV